jgi:hypothetical protein
LAAVATLVGVLHSAQSYFGRSNWYVYVFFAAQVLAIVVPSLGTAVLSARAWGRSSYVLGIDETHSPVVDEQLACDESRLVLKPGANCPGPATEVSQSRSNNPAEHIRRGSA